MYCKLDVNRILISLKIAIFLYCYLRNDNLQYTSDGETNKTLNFINIQLILNIYVEYRCDVCVNILA